MPDRLIINPITQQITQRRQRVLSTHGLTQGILATTLVFGGVSMAQAGVDLSGGKYRTFQSGNTTCPTPQPAPALGSKNYIGACGQATGGNVGVSDGSIFRNTNFDVFGGFSFIGDAANNTVTMSGGSLAQDGSALRLVGGKSQEGSAYDNRVKMTGGRASSLTGGASGIGGSSDTASSANNNVVEVEGGNIGFLTGGVNYAGGDAYGNTVTVTENSGSVDSVTVIGGETGAGNATDNKVNINAGTFRGIVQGGTADAGNADGNKVVITGGKIDAHNSTGSVWGGVTGKYNIPGGSANKNSVKISGATTEIRTDIIGGESRNSLIDVTGNSVEINGGTLSFAVGGKGYSANGNNVSVGDGFIRGVIGGSGDQYASSNTVTVTGGEVRYITGGRGKYANDNIVTISGGEAGKGINGAGTIYGGHADAEGSTANNNRVILKGAPLIPFATLSGGYAPFGSSTGNILEIRSSGITAKSVEYFQEYHFLLPASTTDGTTVLTLTGTGPTDLQGAKIGVGIQSDNNGLMAGDQITLMNTASGLRTDATIDEAVITAYQGLSRQYEFDLSADTNNLYATVQGQPTDPGDPGDPVDPGDTVDPSDPVDPGDTGNPSDPNVPNEPGNSGGGSAATLTQQTKAPVEGYLASMALLRQSSDMLTQGISKARQTGSGSFGAISAGDSRYKTGSHIDVTSVGFLVGVARQQDSTTRALFIEGGSGHIRSYNTFDTGTVRGKGKSGYIGLGALLHHEWLDADTGPYVEGALRLGHTTNEWSSNEMNNSSGEVSYDTSANYYGAHAGAGYQVSLNEKTLVDTSAKYFWAHMEGANAMIEGDLYHFSSIDSQVTQLGVRVSHELSTRFTGYTGAAWEHDFSGHAQATVFGLTTEEPSLEGDTGVFEIGVTTEQNGERGMSVDVSLQGYIGRREGVNGQVQLIYQF